jgi:Family of unknown function (DUF5304)
MATNAEAHEDAEEHLPDPATCPVAWCPICIAVGAVQPVAPDVVEHLLKAGTEMFLAFRAIVEQRGDDLTGRKPTEPVRLEKIDIG